MSSVGLAERAGRFLCAACAVLLLYTAAPAAAQPIGEQPRRCVVRGGQPPPETTALPIPVIVDVVLAGNGHAPALAAVIRELLGRLEVVVCASRAGRVDPVDVVLPPADPAPALARVWIAPTSKGATIYIVDEDWNRILVRHVPLSGGLEVAAREELAQIVYSTVEALHAGAKLGVEREAPAEPVAVEPEPDRTTVEAQLRYAGRLAGRGSPVDHELALAGVYVAQRTRFAPVVGVAIAYRFPDTATTELVDIRSSGAQLRLELGLEIDVARATSLRPGIGFGLELEFVDPRAVEGSGVLPEPSRVALWPLGFAQVALLHRVRGRFSVAGALTAAVDLLGERYAVDDRGENRIVAEPWLVRPGVWLGVVGEL